MSRSHSTVDAMTLADHANASREAAGIPSVLCTVRLRTLPTGFYVLGFPEDQMQ